MKLLYIIKTFLLLIALVTTPLAQKRLDTKAQQSNRRWDHQKVLASIEAEVDTPAPVAALGLPSDSLEEGCGLHLLRLPVKLVPYHYDLVIMPDLDSLSFEGAVQISIWIQEEQTNTTLGSKLKDEEAGNQGDKTIESLTQTGDFVASDGGGNEKELEANQIVLHADESLKIDNVWYLDLGVQLTNSTTNSNKSMVKGGSYIKISNICRDQEYQLMVITLAKNLEPGSRGQLQFTFAGLLSDNRRGFYKSAYHDVNNHTRYHATTQFQATEARHVFPCFDEPALKSTFDLTLIHSADRISLANMEPIYERFIRTKLRNRRENATSDNINDGHNEKEKQALPVERKFVRFARTPPMSTYLLAFVVGEFDYVERSIFNKKLRVRVYTPLGRSQQGKFALDTACRAIQLMLDYFGIELPLNKLDLIAIPDFEAGAMENWGLITFKETQLLVDDLNTTPEMKALIASTIVHELAHQWFGNLVTMEWWNDLWLNEGFATWMEYKLTGELYPEFEFDYHYILDSHIFALNEDMFRSAHPIQTKILEDTRDIDDLFDAISYNKAAAIIRILHDDYLKPVPFKLAIREYLSTHKYKNTNTKDLWHSMELSSNGRLPVRQFMQSWISQPGHPLIKVSFSGDNLNELIFEQERFLTNVEELEIEELQQHWMIPVTVLISGDDHDIWRQELMQLMVIKRENSTQRIKLPVWFNGTKSGHWLKLNANFSGFYRVQYPSKIINLMRAPIEQKIMLPIDRLNVVDEAHTLVLANKMSSDQLFNMLTWFSNENNGAVLDTLVAAFGGLLRIYEHHHLREKLVLVGHRMFADIYRKFGFKTTKREGHIEKIGRSSVLSMLVHTDYEPAIDEALRLFGSGLMPVAPFLRRSVYTALAKRGSDAQYERLFTLFNGTDSREERTRLAYALARATQQGRLEQTWQWLKRRDLDLADKFDVLTNMLTSKTGRNFVKRLFEEQLNELVALNNQRPVTGLIEELCISMGAHLFPEMSKLFSRHKSVTDWRSSHDYIKRMLDWQSAVRSRGAKRIESALDDYLEQQPH